jgi:HAD superfamily hydrolase (TIGR01509 family)
MSLDTQRIQALCFDVDGTLSDTDDLFVQRVARLLRPFHFLFPQQDAVRVARRIVMATESPANILVGLPDVIGLDDEIMALAHFVYRRLGYRPKRNFLLVPGVKEMLAQLDGRYPMSIVSARDDHSTQAFLEQYDLLQYFKHLATGQTCEHTKPYPDPILWAAKKMGVPPSACLMIGDTTVDIRAGRAAGAQTVGVLCGFGEEEELRRRGADLILESTADLAGVLLRRV